MATKDITVTAPPAVEALFDVLPPGTSLFGRSTGKYGSGKYSACCNWPHDAITGSEHIHGSGDTIAEAIDEMMRNLDLAKTRGRVLTTPAAVKNAVIDLIREHDAAPASFRAAVDDLRVKGY